MQKAKDFFQGLLGNIGLPLNVIFVCIKECFQRFKGNGRIELKKLGIFAENLWILQRFIYYRGLCNYAQAYNVL